MHRCNFMRLAAVLLGLMACAGRAPRSGVAAGDALDIQIYVDNNLRGVTAVSVYLLTDAGGRRSLGPIESNERGTWDRSVRPGEYQLLATRVGDDDILSERFHVDARNRLVVWALAQNQLTFGQR